VERSVEIGGWSMKRVIKVLVVAVLTAIILVASVSPAMARRASGGVLLETPRPCDPPANAQNVVGERDAIGERVVLNPRGRTPGCWVLLPTSAN
jgi:hypothetical protein